MYRKIILLCLLYGGYANAHQFTPTYPEISPSHISNINKATMFLFNKRQDIVYYEISAFNEDWEAVSFATNNYNNIFKIEYLKRAIIDVYFPRGSLVTYICSESKINRGQEQVSAVSSKICSRVK